MNENTSNTPKAPTLIELINEEQSKSSRRHGFLMAAPLAGTLEQREENRQRQDLRYQLEMRSRGVFVEALRGCSSPRYMLALPWILANNYELGTNAVMRLIVSDEVTEDRIKYVDELLNQAWQRNALFTPHVDSVFLHFDRMHTLTDCTLAECYWLMELCTWAHRLQPYFSDALTKSMAVERSVEELDFTRVLDRDNENDANLLGALHAQYSDLEKILNRI